MSNSGAIIIPARYKSTRFPGKPLADICGKPMIQWVYEKCVSAVGAELVYVATDSIDIKNSVHGFSGNVIMTSGDCLTGTDRIAEANKALQFDFVVNVQGDEPLIHSKDIKKVFNLMLTDTSHIVNCYCKIDNDEINMPSVPKVAISESKKLIYMSRSGIPFDKNLKPNAMFKQVCIYGFSQNHLEKFSAHPSKSINESYEDIEILRFLDMDIPVQMLEVEKGNVAVDTPNDLIRVLKIMTDSG
jgi:3-deoxy-manno-octulosonate cytidylyltransferase (CMP-KDO synthetase)